MAVDLAKADEMLDKYLEAETTVLTGQEYTIGQRTLKRADLKEIQEGRKYWQKVVDSFNGGGSMKVRRVLPNDH